MIDAAEYFPHLSDEPRLRRGLSQLSEGKLCEAANTLQITKRHIQDRNVTQRDMLIFKMWQLENESGINERSKLISKKLESYSRNDWIRKRFRKTNPYSNQNSFDYLAWECLKRVETAIGASYIRRIVNENSIT